MKAVLFDLDGTLLPMDQDLFIKAYFKGLSARLSERGYEPQAFLQAIWKGIGAMLKNDGTHTNERRFWEAFTSVYGEKALEDVPYFEAYYQEEFPKLKAILGYDERAGQIVKTLKSRGVRVILATNPVFPEIATKTRMQFAGLTPSDFELVTTYENSSYCKPNPLYYAEIFEKTGLKAEDCVMVGNDVNEDMVAASLGCKVFLLTDCLINSSDENIERYPHGGFEALSTYLDGVFS